MEFDRDGEGCFECHHGYYKETSLQDDVQGVLHCSNCGHEIKRWITVKIGGGTTND